MFYLIVCFHCNFPIFVSEEKLVMKFSGRCGVCYSLTEWIAGTKGAFCMWGHPNNFVVTARAVEPKPGAGAQAILDGWSRSQSQKILAGGAGAWNSGSGWSELYKWKNVLWKKFSWSRNQNAQGVGTGAGVKQIKCPQLEAEPEIWVPAPQPWSEFNIYLNQGCSWVGTRGSGVPTPRFMELHLLLHLYSFLYKVGQ